MQRKKSHSKNTALTRSPTRSQHASHELPSRTVGGMLEEQGLPQCNLLARFRLPDGFIEQFHRTFASPTDCVINALQLLGVVDQFTSDCMRVTSMRTIGMSSAQIELIFALKYRHNFLFTPFDDFTQFANLVENGLPNGYGVFAGHGVHVFVIARSLDGAFFYIDPQRDVVVVPMYTHQFELLKLGYTRWFLLHTSYDTLTSEQERTVQTHVSTYLHNPVPL
jgi:hypothetical protein